LPEFLGIHLFDLLFGSRFEMKPRPSLEEVRADAIEGSRRRALSDMRLRRIATIGSKLQGMP
jgi:hypothetical protein